jgi:hypothetical protein
MLDALLCVNMLDALLCVYMLDAALAHAGGEECT